MPANRRPVDRQVKQDEIVRAAADLFSELGFDETPMTQLAVAAGVTTTTIYWYFADKDALLVAVLDHLLAEALEELAAQGTAPWSDQVLWAADRLQGMQRLVTAVHARAVDSPSVAAWHDRFHGLTEGLLSDGFREAGVPDSAVAAATTMGVYVVEGLLTHPQDERTRRAIIELLTTGLPAALRTGR